MQPWPSLRSRSVNRAVIAVVAGATLAVTGCASDPATGSPTAAPVAGRSYPTQPYDILRGGDLGLVEFAQLKLFATCMAEAGYRQNRDALTTRRPGDPIDGIRVAAATFGPTSEDQARRMGFGADSPGEPARIISFDPNYDRNVSQCDTKAWQRLGSDAQDVYLAYFDLVNLLTPYRDGYVKRLPADLSGKMYDCLTSKRFNTDRDAFIKVPNWSTFGIPMGRQERGSEEDWVPQNKPGTVQVGPAIPPRAYHPTPQESALAVAWYQCDQQTGWVAQLLEAAFAEQQVYVDRYQDRTTELNTRLAVVAKSAAAIIAGS